ncbi:HNH endonuclease [Paucisalibacillus globulus]|uniref:HNH endonuclease n=1 Tax=Paucisalibacillus globulus TaxID=351095 RepID=UPI0004286370|nr:HNH endonuclease [Paucisalibacillus globulus]
MKKNCLNCDKEIKVKPSHYDRKKYCSRACKTDYQRKNPPQFWKELKKKQTINCIYCNNEIERKPSEIGERNFCNHECKRLYQLKYGHLINQHLRKDVTIICKTCSKEFIVPKNRQKTAKYCSKNCLGKANGERAKVQYKMRTILYCTNCSKKFEKKPSAVRVLNFCSIECMGIYYTESKMFAGANSGTWAGGDINYYGPNWLNQRRIVRKRDNYICQDCGVTEKEYGQELSVHHIIPFREFNGDWEKANQLSNLIALCEYPCHRKRHSRMVDDIV